MHCSPYRALKNFCVSCYFCHSSISEGSLNPMSDSPKRPLRSRQWFDADGKQGFYYRSWLKGLGLPNDMFDGRPVIGICNTWSELTPCNSSFRELAEHVKHGIYEAGGFPLEFPVMSLGETQIR